MHVQFNHIRPWTLRWQCCAESFTVGAALEGVLGGVTGAHEAHGSFRWIKKCSYADTHEY